MQGISGICPNTKCDQSVHIIELSSRALTTPFISSTARDESMFFFAFLEQAGSLISISTCKYSFFASVDD
jgi:hypothetical protein